MRLYASAYLIAACTILTACAGELYKGYEGPDRSKGEIAVLDWSASCCIIVRVRAIDGIYDPKFNAGLCCGGIYHAELLPGKHKIHWEAKIPRTRTIYEAGVINMKAGHVYSVRASRGVWFIPNKGATWIEDLTTGEVVLGSTLVQSSEFMEAYSSFNALYQKGRYAEAEPYAREALRLGTEKLGPNDPTTANLLNNLALLYKTQGRYAEAEPLYQRSLAIKEKALGPEHPEVAKVLENYAALLRETARADEAERMEARAKEIRAKRAEQNLVQ